MRRLSLFVPLALAACTADNISPDMADGAAADTAAPSVRVVDGTLHFATSEAYFDFGREMVNCDPDERRRWEASHGFTSMLSYAEDVMDDYELRLGEALGRPDIFSVAADSTVDLEVPLTLAVLADKEGYFYIGDAICKVDNSGMARVEGGDKAAVDDALTMGVANKFRTPDVKQSSGGVGTKTLGMRKRLSELAGCVYGGKYRLDYSVKLIMIGDGKNPIERAVIRVEQRGKNWKKRRRCWRQHRSATYFSKMEIVLHHTYFTNRLGNHIETFYTAPHEGGNSVNHYSTQELYEMRRGRKVVINDEQPYFVRISGRVESHDVGPWNTLDVEELFRQELNR